MYYTSYFGNIKNIDKRIYKLASISNKKPRFCDADVLDWSFLGPQSDLLDGYKEGKIDQETYTNIYTKNLEEIWPSIEGWMMVNYNKNIVLLCYEGKNKFCHRYILADFLKQKGFDCEEL